MGSVVLKNAGRFQVFHGYGWIWMDMDGYGWIWPTSKFSAFKKCTADSCIFASLERPCPKATFFIQAASAWTSANGIMLNLVKAEPDCWDSVNLTEYLPPLWRGDESEVLQGVNWRFWESSRSSLSPFLSFPSLGRFFCIKSPNNLQISSPHKLWMKLTHPCPIVSPAV